MYSDEIISGLEKFSVLTVEEKMAQLKDKAALEAAWDFIQREPDEEFVDILEQEKNGEKIELLLFSVFESLPLEGKIIALKIFNVVGEAIDYGADEEDEKILKDKFINHEDWTKVMTENDGDYNDPDYENFGLADCVTDLYKEHPEIFNLKTLEISLEGTAEQVLEEIGKMSFDQKYILRYFIVEEIDEAVKKILAVYDGIKTGEEKNKFAEEYCNLMKETFTYGEEEFKVAKYDLMPWLFNLD
jgi:hypothetical protein